MKGIVFTEFLEMVESTFGLETVDYIIENSNLESEGIYTSVGTYDFIEMVNLITKLSEKVKIPVNTLVYEYGKYFFNVSNNIDCTSSSASAEFSSTLYLVEIFNWLSPPIVFTSALPKVVFSSLLISTGLTS